MTDGQQPLCGRKVHWWWRNGMGCPATLATTEHVPDGSVNTWSQPYFTQLDMDTMTVFAKARLLHERLVDTARNVGYDFTDLLSTATPQEVRRAALIARDRIQDLTVEGYKG